jgi:S-formylglutathione hydrolase FrmB
MLLSVAGRRRDLVGGMVVLMRWGLVVAFAGAALVSGSVSSAGSLPGGPDPCVAGTAQTLTVADPSAAGGQRAVWVYRPPGPDSAAIPVVYFLHGLPGGAGDADHGGFASILDHYRCLGHRPVVFVVPDGTVPEGTDTEWGDDARGRFALETFVTSALIDAVEGTQGRTVAHRALTGFSMGGYGALTIGLRHRIYGRIASLAGYYSVDDPAGVFASRSRFHDPAHLLSRGHGLPVLLEDAVDDPDALTAGEAARFGGLMRQRGLPVSVRERRGSHSLSFVARELPGVLAWLEGGWPHSPGT